MSLHNIREYQETQECIRRMRQAFGHLANEDIEYICDQLAFHGAGQMVDCITATLPPEHMRWGTLTHLINDGGTGDHWLSVAVFAGIGWLKTQGKVSPADIRDVLTHVYGLNADLIAKVFGAPDAGWLQKIDQALEWGTLSAALGPVLARIGVAIGRAPKLSGKWGNIIAAGSAAIGAIAGYIGDADNQTRPQLPGGAGGQPAPANKSPGFFDSVGKALTDLIGE